MAPTSPHWVSLAKIPPLFESDLGSVQAVDHQALPLLNGLSIKRVVLAPNTLREPQWNVNSNQLAYVVRGEVLVSMLGSGNQFSSFVAGEGQMYHVESGSVYHIENLAATEAEVIIALRSEQPQHFSLRDSFSAMTDSVLGNTYDLPSSAFDAFARPDAQQILPRQTNSSVNPTDRFPNAHLFDVEGQHPPTAYDYGSARLARKQFWAALEDLSMYSLRIKENGMRDAHWHPVTAEMGYVAQGRARMRILDPDVTLDEYELDTGDVYFVPRAYPHHIEVLGDEAFHFLIFFDQPTPGDIGYRTTATAFSREVLASTLGVDERDVPDFPFTTTDPLIVGRKNPTPAPKTA
ncbi:cupin domain-containing protein [Streptomyces sp. Vc74B-19]|uniref:cupin domain-containing protein n=1 Tax=Streptomyces sp. Vc74B-19 TaxID=2741324 RepID=UPI001BFC7EFA|nr:cupin domain-containing protein [Streptomyces sp. Vc74B-19]MBT3167752.1 cupin domain-containing protein [Streptomyces sp. Vc74B-19]